ncbi:MAG: ATP-grasp domain-containing protein [Planctomycetes bacterium]|nr:ATP-grasp domain-containing protein [Planctomycetota bacterium]
MKPPCVWFNKQLSNTWELMPLLAEARRAGEFRMVCSHPRLEVARRFDCDRQEREPARLGDDEYVRFCLDFASRHGVRFFFPGHKVLPIVQAAAHFEAIGTRVVASAKASTLALVRSKAKIYAALAGEPWIPDHTIVRDLSGFDAALKQLRARHRIICCKPDTSVFGLGFHILHDGETPVTSHDPALLIELEAARRRLVERRSSRDLMLMQYLPGPERSVDCLARGGELLRCVIRSKMNDGQMLEENPEIESIVRQLTARFGLNNLFNVQFRDAGGRSYLLEINARMSGGLPFSCQSGFAFPLWAIRLALGKVTPEAMPYPRAGVWVPQTAAARSV